MKRKQLVRAVVGVVLAGALSGWALAGIEGSKHDFSAQTGDLCSACHLPHQSEAPPAAPLWDTGADLSRRFGNEDKGTPGWGTKLCLTCHDGTLAKDTSRSALTLRLVGEDYPARFGTGHQTTDHPVGVKYPQTKRGYRPVTSVLATGAVTLPKGRVECSSCHDPHHEAQQPAMLVLSNVRSALCLTCHKK
ncbi:MAG TPA: cytochrome c3 family protein [Phycisphaerae bacterium]|nr:cytochrome c3 family protein [Phycisphaerae bacterium]HNU45309.1 cytochrome c3 family protein [Phycisphaerae bacterium]